MATYPLINGTYPDFASIEIKVRGTHIIGISEISYSDNLEPGVVRGTHAQALGSTTGEYTAEASMTMYRPEFDELITRLGNGYKQVPFDIVVNYRPPGGKMITDKIIGARITNVEISASQGSDPVSVSVTLAPNHLILNGVEPLKQMLPR